MAQPAQRSSILPWLLLLLLAAMWSPSFMIIKIALREIPPLTLAAGRVILAAVFSWGLMRLSGNRLPRDPLFWRRFAIMGFLANALPFSVLMVGETMAPSAVAAIFNGFTPVATAIIAHYTIEEERLNSRTIIGVLLGFGGIVMLFIPALVNGLEAGSGHHDGTNGSDSLLIGMAAFLVMAISYAFSAVYGRKMLRGYPKFVGPTAQLATSSVMMIPFTLAFEWDRITIPSLEPAIAFVWLAIVATALAYVVYYRLMEMAGATFLSLTTFLIPPAGAILGVIFLDEKLGWNAALGCAAILSGAMFVRNR